MFAVARLYDEATRPTACQFLEELPKVVPYPLHTMLTDRGIQFAEQPRSRNTSLLHLAEALALAGSDREPSTTQDDWAF